MMKPDFSPCSIVIVTAADVVIRAMKASIRIPIFVVAKSVLKMRLGFPAGPVATVLGGTATADAAAPLPFVHSRVNAPFALMNWIHITCQPSQVLTTPVGVATTMTLNFARRIMICLAMTGGRLVSLAPRLVFLVFWFLLA